MSHLITIQTEIRDPVALRAACSRLGIPLPERGTAKLYDGSEHTGLILRLSGWHYPVIITDDCQAHYDNFGGHWGQQSHLDRLMQCYAVEKAKIEARRKGYVVKETTLRNGSIKLEITTHA